MSTWTLCSPALRARLLLLAAALAVGVVPARATTYYVDPAGDDTNPGDSPGLPWRTVGRVNSASFASGDTVLFRRGGAWDEDLDVADSGVAGSPISYGAYDSGPRPVLRRLTTRGAYTVFEDLVVDHQFLLSDAVRTRNSADHVTFRRLEVRNVGGVGGSTGDGIDLADADDTLIEDCHIHHVLGGSFVDQIDGHGIVATDVQRLTIRRTEVHHVSGDSFQADPNRSVDSPEDVVIEGCHFWTGPLAASYALWNAGEIPGENAVDTKVSSSAARGTFTITDTVAHGWVQDDPACPCCGSGCACSYICNRAAFNRKENITAVFDRVTVYDSEIGFRLRGDTGRGNADVTIRNAALYDLDSAIRSEDDLENLRLLNSTLGDGINLELRHAGGSGGTATWTWLNNAFAGAKPTEAGDPSNLVAAAADFEDPASRDYHPSATSSLIDAGLDIAEVTTDRDGVARSPGGYDVGAFERVACATPTPPEVVLLKGVAGPPPQFVWSGQTRASFTTWSAGCCRSCAPTATTAAAVAPSAAMTSPSPIGPTSVRRRRRATGITTWSAPRTGAHEASTGATRWGCRTGRARTARDVALRAANPSAAGCRQVFAAPVQHCAGDRPLQT